MSKRSDRLFILRVRNDDGSWSIDPKPRNRKETDRAKQYLRCLFGTQSQEWPLAEAQERFPEAFADDPTAAIGSHP